MTYEEITNLTVENNIDFLDSRLRQKAITPEALGSELVLYKQELIVNIEAYGLESLRSTLTTRLVAIDEELTEENYLSEFLLFKQESIDKVNAKTVEGELDILSTRVSEKLAITPQMRIDELEVWKLELGIYEDERLRKVDLWARVEAIKESGGGIPLFHRIKPDVPNAKKYIRNLIEDQSREVEAEDFISQLEAENVIYLQELADAEAAEAAETAQLQDMKDNLILDLDGMSIPPRVKTFLKYLARNEFKKLGSQ